MARPPRRIHIAGGPGTGKTTLALDLARVSGLPVHHLDDIARVGGGTGRVRGATERAPLLGAILDADAWVTEGVHLGWTDPLLARAELVIWLDTAAGTAAAGRIAGRFVRGAWAEMRRRSWRERIAGLPGYVRHLRDLVGAMWDARRYGRPVGHPGEPPSPVDPSGTLDSRAATMAALAPFADRVVTCRTPADVEAITARVAGAAATQP
jgi:hypothetical protein